MCEISKEWEPENLEAVSTDRGNRLVAHVPHKCTLNDLHIIVLQSTQMLQK